MTAPQIFAEGALTLEQWQHVEALARTLSPAQARWISGYFAGLGLRPASLDEAVVDPAGSLLIPLEDLLLELRVLVGDGRRRRRGGGRDGHGGVFPFAVGRDAPGVPGAAPRPGCVGCVEFVTAVAGLSTSGGPARGPARGRLW